MIFNQIINIIILVLNGLTFPIRQLSDVTLPAAVSDAIETVAPPLATMQAVFPVTTLLTIAALFLAIEAAFFVYHLIMWVIHRIPFIG